MACNLISQKAISTIKDVVSVFRNPQSCHSREP